MHFDKLESQIESWADPKACLFWGQSCKANFCTNYIKNRLNKLNFTSNYIYFDVIYAKKVL